MNEITTPRLRLRRWTAEDRAPFAAMNADPRVMYAAVAPRPEDWAVLVTKVMEAVGRDYDLSREAASLEMPVLLAGVT
jgi:RimJ/RimL family protein N-acetyltransferase